MKKLLCLLCIFFCLFSCGEDKEIPTENPPIDNPDPNENPVTNDSLFYQLNVEGYELIAATQSGTSLFLQADTTFAFRCLYDSCKTDRLVAYCDSTGMVERIIVEDRVFDMLYHEDYKKMDILFSNEGKMEWIKNVENPYFDQSSRSTEENVPYSAISVVSNLSYAVYKIIDTCPLYMKKSLSGLVKFYGMPPVETETAIQMIVKILGENFDETIIKQQYATIATVMKDYSKWVMDELYGDAIPLTYTWVERMKNDSIRFRAYVNDVDSSKTDFRMGMYIESGAYTHRPFHKHDYKEDMETGFRHKKCALMATYNGSMQYGFVSDALPSGKKYKFRSFLVPLASSKYLNDMKCLVDYTCYGETDYFYLFEAKANVVSTEEDKATLMLSTELDDYHKKFKLGVYYGTNPDLPENDRMKMEVDVQSLTSDHTGMINEEITLTGLEPETTYYFMPFIQYDGNIVNRSLENVTNVTIFDKDKIFVGEGGSFTTEEEKEENDDSEGDNENDEWIKGGKYYDSIRRVLEKLYKDTNGDDWHRNDNWLSDKPLNEWYGVKCFRNIIEGIYGVDLYLAENNLVGNIDLSGIKDFYFTLDLSDNNISNLNASGSNLRDLEIIESNLKSLNVTGCNYLVGIECQGNQLTSLNLDSPNIIYVSCGSNQITSLNIKSELLDELHCSNNQLSTLEIGHCKSLLYLHCSNNQLRTLDLNSSVLAIISCNNNQLSSLKIDSKKLRKLECYNNQLTSLDIKGYQSLQWLRCENNKIKKEITRGLLESWVDPPFMRQFMATFSRDYRYTGYWKQFDNKGNVIDSGYTDNGVGWWCSGEPDSGTNDISQLFE